jgi:hypothetical protein
MDITANQLLLAFDEYMKNNGGGSKYLQAKFRKIFENKDAPLNGETGPLVKLADASKTFAKKLAAMSSKLEKPLGKFKDSLSKSVDTFNDLSKYVKSLKPTNAIPPPIASTIGGTNQPLNLTNFMVDMRKMISETESPMVITGISAAALATLSGLFTKKEDILPPKDEKEGFFKSLLATWKEKTDQKPKKEKTTNIFDQEDSGENKGSLLGSILKWGALILTGAYIIKLLNETPLGKKIKGFIKETITGIFTWISEKLTNKETKGYLNKKLEDILGGIGDLMSMVGNALASVGRGLMFIAHEFYDKVILKIKEENEGLAKIVSAGALKAIPKFFGKTTAVIKFIAKGAAKHFTQLAKVFKWIPGVGSLLSFAFAVDRFRSGDYFGGLLEVAAGIAYFVPGIGTAIGIGIDVLNTFLDYKQSQPENKNIGKGEIVVGLMERATEWFIGKFGVERLYQIPVIGPMMKIVKGLTMLSTDPGEGMKAVLKGIFAFNPITQLANAVSFIDFLMNGDVANDPNVNGSISNWFNSDIWIDKIGGFIGGIVDIVTEKIGWLFGQVKSAMEWIFGKSEEELSDMDKLKRDNPKEYRKRKLDEYRASVMAQPSKINIVPINDGKTDGRGITVIKPDAKDHHLFAKDGGPFDLFLKQMNANFDEKLTALVALSVDTVNAIVQSGGQISKTIIATAGSSNQSNQTPTYSNADPVRDFRNRANMIIGR